MQRKRNASKNDHPLGGNPQTRITTRQLQDGQQSSVRQNQSFVASCDLQKLLNGKHSALSPTQRVQVKPQNEETMSSGICLLVQLDGLNKNSVVPLNVPSSSTIGQLKDRLAQINESLASIASKQQPIVTTFQGRVLPDDKMTVCEAGLKHLNSLTVRYGAALVGGMNSSNELSETDIIENVLVGEAVVKAGAKKIRDASKVSDLLNDLAILGVKENSSRKNSGRETAITPNNLGDETELTTTMKNSKKNKNKIAPGNIDAQDDNNVSVQPLLQENQALYDGDIFLNKDEIDVIHKKQIIPYLKNHDENSELKKLGSAGQFLESSNSRFKDIESPYHIDAICISNKAEDVDAFCAVLLSFKSKKNSERQKKQRPLEQQLQLWSHQEMIYQKKIESEEEITKSGLSCWFIDQENQYLIFSENADRRKVTVVKRIIDEVNGDRAQEITFNLPRDISSDSVTAKHKISDVVKRSVKVEASQQQQSQSFLSNVFKSNSSEPKVTNKSAEKLNEKFYKQRFLPKVSQFSICYGSLVLNTPHEVISFKFEDYFRDNGNDAITILDEHLTTLIKCGEEYKNIAFKIDAPSVLRLISSAGESLQLTEAIIDPDALGNLQTSAAPEISSQDINKQVQMLNFENAYDFTFVYIDVEGRFYRSSEHHKEEIQQEKFQIFLEIVTINRRTFLNGVEGENLIPRVFTINDEDAEVKTKPKSFKWEENILMDAVKLCFQPKSASLLMKGHMIFGMRFSYQSVTSIYDLVKQKWLEAKFEEKLMTSDKMYSYDDEKIVIIEDHSHLKISQLDNDTGALNVVEIKDLPGQVTKILEAPASQGPDNLLLLIKENETESVYLCNPQFELIKNKDEKLLKYIQLTQGFISLTDENSKITSFTDDEKANVSPTSQQAKAALTEEELKAAKDKKKADSAQIDNEHNRRKRVKNHISIGKNLVRIFDRSFKQIKQFKGDIKIEACLAQNKDGFLFAIFEEQQVSEIPLAHLEDFKVEEEDDGTPQLLQESICCRGLYALDLKQLCQGNVIKYLVKEIKGDFQDLHYSYGFEFHTNKLWFHEINQVITLNMPRYLSRNIIYFDRMQPKGNYLHWRQKDGFFTAVDKQNILTTWSVSSGNLLYSVALKHPNSLQNPSEWATYWQIDRKSQKGKPGESYRASNHVDGDLFSTNLIIKKKPISIDGTDIIFQFKVIKLQTFADDSLSTEGKCETLLEFEMTFLLAQEDLVLDLINNDYEQEPYAAVKILQKNYEIVISQNQKRLLVVPMKSVTGANTVYDLTKNPKKVVSEVKNMNFRTSRYLYAPNLDYFIHEDAKKVFHIYKDEELVTTLSDAMKTYIDGREPSLGVDTHMRIIRYMASKVKWEQRQYYKKNNNTWESKLQLRFLTKENRDICFGRIRHGRLQFLNWVELDNCFEAFFSKESKNYFDRKQYLPESKTFQRLIRRNNAYKSELSHYGRKLNPYDIEETGLLSRSFRVELSFTVLDWLRMDKLTQHTSGPPSIEQMNLDSMEILQLVFNVLPKGTTFFHHISQQADYSVAKRKPIIDAIDLCYKLAQLAVEKKLTGTAVPVLVKIPLSQNAMMYCIKYRQWQILDKILECSNFIELIEEFNQFEALIFDAGRRTSVTNFLANAMQETEHTAKIKKIQFPPHVSFDLDLPAGAQYFTFRQSTQVVTRQACEDQFGSWYTKLKNSIMCRKNNPPVSVQVTMIDLSVMYEGFHYFSNLAEEHFKRHLITGQGLPDFFLGTKFWKVLFSEYFAEAQANIVNNVMKPFLLYVAVAIHYYAVILEKKFDYDGDRNKEFYYWSWLKYGGAFYLITSFFCYYKFYTLIKLWSKRLYRLEQTVQEGYCARTRQYSEVIAQLILLAVYLPQWMIIVFNLFSKCTIPETGEANPETGKANPETGEEIYCLQYTSEQQAVSVAIVLWASFMQITFFSMLFEGSAFIQNLTLATLKELGPVLFQFLVLLIVFGLLLFFSQFFGAGENTKLVVEEKWGYFMLDLIYYQFNLAMGSADSQKDADAIADASITPIEDAVTDDDPTALVDLAASTAGDQNAVNLLIVGGVFQMQLVLLNMIIAIMGDTFDRVMESKPLATLKNQILISYANQLYEDFDMRPYGQKRFLFIIEPAKVEIDTENEDQENEYDQHGQWRGKLFVIASKIERTKNLLTSAFSANSGAVESTISEMRDKMEVQNNEMLATKQKMEQQESQMQNQAAQLAEIKKLLVDLSARR